MENLKAACILAIVVAPSLAVAGEQAPQARALATAEAILDYCVKISPAAADQYRESAKVVDNGAGDETLAGVRESEEYRITRASMIESLAGINAQDAQTACAQHVRQDR